MKKEIIVPAAGESVTEADIALWYKADGDFVQMDEALLELETDKASMDINAEIDGILTITIEDGTAQVGDVLGYIEPSDQKPADAPASTPAATPEPAAAATPAPEAPSTSYAAGHPSPAAAKLMAEKNVEVTQGSGKDGRVTKADVLSAPAPVKAPASPEAETVVNAETIEVGTRQVNRERMSRLRRTIANRLVEAQQTAALLTTFNEVDMSGVMEIRAKYKEKFKEKHQVGLGFMSFFTKAVCDSLLKFPIMNATVDGQDILYHNYCDIGVAVSTPKGLVVPVVRNAEYMNFQQIESSILSYAKKGHDGKIAPDDMAGGTFTITNGGIFGSMMSTPIVNRPQSAILGMHNIVKRAVVVGDKIEIRPMMYLAVTYDHRIIDGADAVQFLVSIKELIEDPTRLLIGL